MDQFVLVRAVNVFGQSIIISVADSSGGSCNAVLGKSGPDPRKVDTSGASYAAVVSIAEVLVSKTSGATRLHQEWRLRVL